MEKGGVAILRAQRIEPLDDDSHQERRERNG
jgi:hypothetical protein